MSAELLKKLKLTEIDELVVLHDDEHIYFKEVNVLRELNEEPHQNIMLFVTSKEELRHEVFKLIENESLAVNGRLFIAYPKKGNKLFETYVSRDDIHPTLQMSEERYVGNSDYKFNQLLSLDENYSLMTLKRVVKDKTKKIDKSQRVSEYEALIPELMEKLSASQEALSFFETLTPGYQKAWARYIFSAKQEVTREKRLAETVELLTNKVKAKK